MELFPKDRNFIGSSVDEVVNEYFPQPVETVEDGSSDENEVPHKPISPPSENEVNKAFEILNRLTLFTTDLDLDPLLLKVSNKINQIGQNETIFY